MIKIGTVGTKCGGVERKNLGIIEFQIEEND